MKKCSKMHFPLFLILIYRPITQTILVGLIQIYIFLKAQTILYWMILRRIRLVYRFLFYTHVKLKNCENGELYVFLRPHPYLPVTDLMEVWVTSYACVGINRGMIDAYSSVNMPISSFFTCLYWDKLIPNTSPVIIRHPNIRFG